MVSAAATAQVAGAIGLRGKADASSHGSSAMPLTASRRSRTSRWLRAAVLGGSARPEPRPSPALRSRPCSVLSRRPASSSSRSGRGRGAEAALRRIPRLEAQIALRGGCAQSDGTLAFLRSGLETFTEERERDRRGRCTATWHEPILPTRTCGVIDQQLRVQMPACDAFGYSAELAPEVVELDEWGYPVITGPVTPALLADARTRADPGAADPPSSRRTISAYPWASCSAEAARASASTAATQRPWCCSAHVRSTLPRVMPRNAGRVAGWTIAR